MNIRDELPRNYCKCLEQYENEDNLYIPDVLIDLIIKFIYKDNINYSDEDYELFNKLRTAYKYNSNPINGLKLAPEHPRCWFWIEPQEYIFKIFDAEYSHCESPNSHVYKIGVRSQQHMLNCVYVPICVKSACLKLGSNIISEWNCNIYNAEKILYKNKSYYKIIFLSPLFYNAVWWSDVQVVLSDKCDLLYEDIVIHVQLEFPHKNIVMFAEYKYENNIYITDYGRAKPYNKKDNISQLIKDVEESYKYNELHNKGQTPK